MSTTLKESVIATLTAHDALKAHERAEFAKYLHSVFTKAEAYDALEARVTALETK